MFSSTSFTFFFALRFMRSFSLCVRCVFTSACVRVRVCVCCVDFMECVTLHVRIANHVVEDSCCRGGIVNSRGGCSCELLVRPNRSQGALAVSCKYFKQSKWPYSAAQTNTHHRHIYQTYAQQDIRVYEGDHFAAAQEAVLKSQGALTSSRKYLRHSR